MPETLLTRLYHEQNPEVFEPQPIVFKCSCSREKTEAVLKGMEESFLNEQIEAKGVIGVDCQFCNKHYEFNGDDVKHLFE